jgi:hypothetical protein
MKRQFESMSEREIKILDDELYLKWDQRGICQVVQLDEVKKLAKVQPVTKWSFPKSQPIGKKCIKNIEEFLTNFFKNQGYHVDYSDV